MCEYIKKYENSTYTYVSLCKKNTIIRISYVILLIISNKRRVRTPKKLYVYLCNICPTLFMK